MDAQYVKNLENIIKQMLQPLKGVPFNLVVESLSGKSVESFNREDEKDKILLSNLVKAARLAGAEINKKGICRARANEVGNDVEPFVKKALAVCGYADTGTPFTSAGKRKTTGYPDLEFVDQFGRSNYVECKTFNIKNLDTTMRSFYLSPSDQFKVTKNARHFVVSFEIYEAGKTGRMNIYKCKSWKILSLDGLLVNVKYEFNADNKKLYARKLVLAEGAL